MPSSDDNLPFWLAMLCLSEQATRDWLTGLYNRRYFEETLADHIEAARRYECELSLVLFDIDHFKQINDTCGHAAGDEVLRNFAEALKTTARKADIICRYGGDEFAVILPETNAEQARRFIERVQSGVSFSAPTPDSEKQVLPAFTVTAGTAALPCDDLIADADADLMAGKSR